MVPAVASADEARGSAVEVQAVGCALDALRGAGAMIQGGYVVTAAHVVAGALSATVTLADDPSRNAYVAHVAYVDPANDIALLVVPDVVLPQLSIAPLQVNEPGVLYVFRDGVAQELPYNVLRPVLVHILDIYDRNNVDRNGFQIETDVLAGDSGAVLVRNDGSAGGLIYAKSVGERNRAWAVGLDSVPGIVSLISEQPLPQGPVGECAH